MYAPDLAALVIKQAEGNPEEAIFLLRAFRSTLPRKYYSSSVETGEMRLMRRISAAFKDIPGGQILGPSYDYSHRLLDFDLQEEEDCASWMMSFKKKIEENYKHEEIDYLKISNLLRSEGLIKTYKNNEETPFDITRDKLSFPAPRSARLQILSRGETGAVTAIAYSSIRGFGGTLHPTVGELRVGMTDISIPYPLGEDEEYYVGEMMLTEVETIIPEYRDEELEFTLGYGLVMGQNETKAISMSVLDRNLDIPGNSPAQNEEFVLYHVDCVEATGFVSHLKLPHYVTFQSKLDRMRNAKGKQGGVTDEK